MGPQRKIGTYFCFLFLSLSAYGKDLNDLSLNIASGLKSIGLYHLYPYSMDQLTVTGLKVLEQLDTKVQLVRLLGEVDIVYDYKSLGKLSASSQTPESWAVLIEKMVTKLRTVSAPFKTIKDPDLTLRFFGGLLPTLDPYSRVVPEPASALSKQMGQATDTPPTAPSPQPVGPMAVQPKDGGAIIQITTFYPTIAEDILKALGDPKKLEGILLDLRQTSGGSFEGGVALCNLFLAKGIITQTKGRHPESNHIYKATGNAPLSAIPLQIAVSDKTYSTGEMVAAALQDNKRGVVIGGPTFGKDEVQRLVALPNGLMLAITWANFFTPLNQRVKGKGVVQAQSS